MSKPRVIVLRTAGTNCDRETARAFDLAGAIAERVHVNRLVDGSVDLADYDILTVPGGFSYGDDIAAGKVLAVELRGRLGDALHRFVDQGKLVLGICNGFQVLVKTGLLPGAVSGGAGEAATLSWNMSGRFEDRWVRLAVPQGPCVFTRGLSEMELPVAHAEGRFLTASAEALGRLRQQGQVAFRYAAADGGEPAYPENPNGSEDHIAGICDPTGRVLGMMPHPERHVSRFQHPRWTRNEPVSSSGFRVTGDGDPEARPATRNSQLATRMADEGDGLALFRNAVEYAANR